MPVLVEPFTKIGKPKIPTVGFIIFQHWKPNITCQYWCLTENTNNGFYEMPSREDKIPKPKLEDKTAN